MSPVENSPHFKKLLDNTPVGEENAERPAVIAKNSKVSPNSAGDTLRRMHEAGYLKQKIKTWDYKSVCIYWR